MAATGLKRRFENALGAVVVALVIPLCAILATLLLTPAETVVTAGQTIEVSAGLRGLSVYGPAELNLFGASIPTQINFSGPIRPRLKWADVSHYDQLVSGLRQPQTLGQSLLSSWQTYFLHQAIAAVLLSALLAAVVAVLMRLPLRAVAAVMLLGALVTGVAEGGSVFALMRSSTSLSEEVHSLNDVVGRQGLSVQSPGGGGQGSTLDAVVIGDSTAAGAGNPPLPNATAIDEACRRSVDNYGADIAAANDWKVVNIACSNATIADGLFRAENINGSTVPPQLTQLDGIGKPNLIIVSIGANEMHWANLMELCLAASTSCDDAASSAWFQQALNGFALNYYDLLDHLALLPWHPRVLVNEYYSPISPSQKCPASYHLTADKATALLSRLQMFNDALSQGAKGFGFEVAGQNFDGHELCSLDPYIQGPHDDAPMHPNIAGQLAIALADEEALANPRPPTPSPPTPSPLTPSPPATPSPSPS